jgi:hypothetical protein
MNKLYLLPLALAYLFCAPESHGFGGKKMNVTSLNGVTETQVAKGEDHASVLVRGKAAELIFRMMKDRQAEQPESEVAQMAGTGTNHWVAKGQQISCSKVQKKKKTDFACAFELSHDGSVSAGLEPYTPTVFNLAKTNTGSKFFKNTAPASKGRSLASVAPAGTGPAKFSKGAAYVMYDKPENKRDSDDALIVFRGASAKELLHFLSDSKDANSFTLAGGTKGVKGREIACVEKTADEPERCSLVVSFRDGSISSRKNPLLH